MPGRTRRGRNYGVRVVTRRSKVLAVLHPPVGNRAVCRGDAAGTLAERLDVGPQATRRRAHAEFDDYALPEHSAGEMERFGHLAALTEGFSLPMRPPEIGALSALCLRAQQCFSVPFLFFAPTAVTRLSSRPCLPFTPFRVPSQMNRKA